MIRQTVPFIKPSIDNWQKVLKQATKSIENRELILIVGQYYLLEPNQQIQLFRQAIALAQKNKDYQLLIQILKNLKNQASLRAEALAAIFEFANERDKLFIELINTLNNGEKALVLGTFFEATRLDPDKQRRLLRLSYLIKAMPANIRAFYWHEAQTLAEFGNDDSKLLLLGFVREFENSDRAIIFTKLIKIISKIKEPFKHSMAYVVLADLGAAISLEQIDEAKIIADSIPEHSLRSMVLARLDDLVVKS